MCLFANLRIVFKNPLDFRRREITVEEETCLLAELGQVNARGERITDRLSARVLPNDCRSHRFARILIPKDKGLSLVIESDSRDIVFFEQWRTGFFDSPDYVQRILFHPARLRKARR